MSEVDRITKVYRHYRESADIQALWDEQNPGNQEILKERQYRTKKLLDSFGLLPLGKRKILEVGCGSGKTLASLIELGARPENLFGVDLLPDRIEEAHQSYPNLNFQCDNAEHLNLTDESFDLILLFTVFSSILDDNMARNIATEVYRLLKPKGAVLWYDFRYNNPNNPNVRGMTRNQIERLFPQLRIHLQTLTLIPPLARRLGLLTNALYPVLSVIPILRTHYLGLLIKERQSNSLEPSTPLFNGLKSELQVLTKDHAHL